VRGRQSPIAGKYSRIIEPIPPLSACAAEPVQLLELCNAPHTNAFEEDEYRLRARWSCFVAEFAVQSVPGRDGKYGLGANTQGRGGLRFTRQPARENSLRKLFRCRV